MTEHDELPPDDPLAALGAAWRAQPVPPLDRELATEDETTRRAVQWMASAFRAPGVLEPSAAATQRARFAARRHAAPRPAPVGLRRQVAAAAVLVALLSAALWLGELPWFASRDATRSGPAPRTVAEDIGRGAAAAPLAPAVAAAAGSTLSPPLEMRSGNVRLILFTDASQSVSERLP